jgi:hypothetical protein
MTGLLVAWMIGPMLGTLQWLLIMAWAHGAFRRPGRRDDL